MSFLLEQNFKELMTDNVYYTKNLDLEVAYAILIMLLFVRFNALKKSFARVM